MRCLCYCQVLSFEAPRQTLLWNTFLLLKVAYMCVDDSNKIVLLSDKSPQVDGQRCRERQWTWSAMISYKMALINLSRFIR